MRKILVLFMAMILTLPAIAKTDKTSVDYLKNKKHLAIMNPICESFAQSAIKKALKKETGANFKVKFEGYTLSSMKKGIFKYLEVTGEDVVVEGIDVPYLNFKTLSDYNWIDYNKDPVEFKSDMTFLYNMKLSEKSINTALKDEEYQKTIQKVNKRAYPLFAINDVRVRVKQDKIHLIISYNFPITPAKKNRTFMVSCSLKVEDGQIKASNIGFDNAYGNLPLDKVANLINLLDPLSFTLDLMDSKKCDAKIDNVKIVDNMVLVDGKIFVEGD